MPLPKTFKRAVFPAHGQPLSLEEVPLQLPGKGEILIKVEACGICHSDVFAQYNGMGGGFPLCPGHEIIGRGAAIGEEVAGWKIGDRIGAGWHGGHDGTCKACQKGFFQACENAVVTGETVNGGCDFFHPIFPSDSS